MLHEGAEVKLGSGAVAAMPGTCGELFQGTLDGQPCLVSLPIDRWSLARVEWLDQPDQWSVPVSREKTLKAMRLAAMRWRRTGSARLDWASQLPEDKGFGSSTADIVAALYALAHALDYELEPWSAVNLAVSIEPTDSSPLPDLALMDHRGGKWWQPLPPPPPMDVLVVDTGGTVDTMAFNRLDYDQVALLYDAQHADAFGCLIDGLRSGSLRLIGEAATLSAQVQQKILPKPCFDDLLELSRQTGAVGVNIAHSGTLVGFLYGAGNIDRERVGSFVESRISSRFKLYWQHAIAGGVRWTDRGVKSAESMETDRVLKLLS